MTNSLKRDKNGKWSILAWDLGRMLRAAYEHGWRPKGPIKVHLAKLLEERVDWFEWRAGSFGLRISNADASSLADALFRVARSLACDGDTQHSPTDPSRATGLDREKLIVFANYCRNGNLKLR